MTPPVHSPLLSPTEFRAALRAYATGVTIVTCFDPRGQPVGLTVNSFASVSLDPPLILWSLNRRSVSHRAYAACLEFGVNVLTGAQQSLAQRFSSKERGNWQGVDWSPGPGGTPLIRGAMAWFECTTRRRYDEGDHTLFIGQVTHCGRLRKAAPLLFLDGRYHAGAPYCPRTDAAGVT